MPQDDEYGFWKDDRGRPFTGPIPRLSRTPRRPPARSSAASTWASEETAQSLSTESQDGWRAGDVGQEVWGDIDRASPWALLRRHPGRPPKIVLRRIGALVVLGVVAAPIALLIGGFGDAAPRVTTIDPPAGQRIAESEPVTAPPDQATPVTTAPATVLAPAATVAAVTTQPAAVQPTPVASTSTLLAAMGPPPTTAVAETSSSAAATAGTAPSTSETAQDRAVTSDTIGAADTTNREAAPETKVVASCSNEYQVEIGDYWILIADKVSVRLDEILSINGANAETLLYPGRTICLPSNASAPTDPPNTTGPPTTTAATTTVKPTTTTVRPTTTTVKPTTTTAAPATTVAPSTTAAPPTNTYSRAEVEQIIRDVWPDDLEDEALRIATRESNLIPTVRNHCCFGLFQLYWNVHKDWMAAAGVTSSNQLYDPLVNAYLAYSMYLRSGGWGPWE